MAQTKNHNVLEQIFHDLQMSCYSLALELKAVLRVNKLSDDAHTVYVDALFDLYAIYSTMNLCQGMYVHARTANALEIAAEDDEYKKLDKVINSLDKLEGQYKGPMLERDLERLKTAVISMQEYDGSWEALYTTEEPPF